MRYPTDVLCHSQRRWECEILRGYTCLYLGRELLRSAYAEGEFRKHFQSSRDLVGLNILPQSQAQRDDPCHMPLKRL